MRQRNHNLTSNGSSISESQNSAQLGDTEFSQVCWSYFFWEKITLYHWCTSYRHNYGKIVKKEKTDDHGKHRLSVNKCWCQKWAWLCVHCNIKLCDETHDTSHNVPTFASFLRLLAKCLLQSLLFYCLFIFISRLSFLAGSTWTTRGLVAHWALLCLPLFNTISYNNSVVLTEFLWNVLLCYFY